MQAPKKKNPPGTPAITRRQMLAGAAAVAIAAAAPSVIAKPAKPVKPRPTNRSTTPLRRSQAASVQLRDGRILVTGGYDRQGGPALSSVAILDPANGEWAYAAPMKLGRARHAVVLLSDGRVAVIGGLGSMPTASVEIYDPVTNAWHTAPPLAQARYDHNAVCDNGQITIIGGSSMSQAASIETYQVQRAQRLPETLGGN